MTVFANGLEVACKAQGNKVIAAFPDVCFTPPENPATPPGVPVPYPSFGLDSDTDNGTGTVKIGGQTITQKNKSYYTRTSGTEAGCATKKGVITSTNTGKEYAEAWSSDVKADGEPVSRMTDISTNNHASPVGNTPPFPKVGEVSAAFYSTENCLVGTYDAIKDECNKAGGEAHHMVPDKCFRTGTRKQAGEDTLRIANAPSLGDGMCICVNPDAHKKLHESERDKLDALGKKPAEGLTGARLDAAKKSAEYGTANVADIHAECQDSLDSLKPQKQNKNTEECIAKAKEAIAEQSDLFSPRQAGRTSNQLPNAAAKAKMIP